MFNILENDNAIRKVLHSLKYICNLTVFLHIVSFTRKLYVSNQKRHVRDKQIHTSYPISSQIMHWCVLLMYYSSHNFIK